VSERTDLATKIVRALWPSERREQVLDARIATVRGVLEREGLSDLEAKLEAKERELEEARGRLEKIARIAGPGVQHGLWQHQIREIRRLATEKEG